MKALFYFLCLSITACAAYATVQTVSSQDKQPFLYITSASWHQTDTTYDAIGNTNYLTIGTENGDWQQGVAGMGSAIDKEFSDLGGNTSYWSSTNIFTWGADWWPNLDQGAVDFINEPFNALVRSGTGGYSSVDVSGGGIFDGWLQEEDHSEIYKMTWHLKTGGTAGSKQQNLFGLGLSGVGQQNWGAGDFTEGPGVGVISTQGIIPTQVQIGSFGTLHTNWILYKVLPDNADVDVTPYVGGSSYYSYTLNIQKYYSYLDIYVQQANPGYSLNFSNPTNDVGHAFWQFRTDAPSDAMQYISPSLTVFLGNRWGFYPNGIPSLSNGFSVPGQLENDNDHSYNISRTFHIGFPDLLQGLEYTRGTSNAPPEYVLSAFNCVGAARGAGFAADIFGLPLDESPQNFGVSLIEMYPAPGQVIGPFIDTQDIFYSDTPY